MESGPVKSQSSKGIWCALFWKSNWWVWLVSLYEEKQMSHFDERSGVVYCKTDWGQWGQTIEEVFVEVDVAEGTKARDIRCDIKPKSISLTVSNKVLIQVL